MDSALDCANIPILVESDTEGWEVACNDELEVASFLTLIESKREKGGGFFSKKQAEKLSFISYVSWPLLFMKRKDKEFHVVFDTLGFFSQTFNYATLPSTEAFIEHLKSDNDNNRNPDAYIVVLKTYENAFKDFAGTIEHIIQGCLPHEDLLKDILEYTKFASNERENKSIFSLPARLSVDQTSRSLELLMDMKQRAKTDIDRLSQASNILLSVSTEWSSRLTDNQSEISNRFNSMIEQMTPEVQTRVTDYQQRMNMEMHSIEMRTSPSISMLQAEVQRWEREEDMHKRMGKGHEKMKDAAKHQKDRTKDQLHKIQKERDNGIKKTHDQYEKLINEQWERIRSVERERDRQIKELEDRKKEIASRTSNIEEKIEKLIKRKNGFIGAIDEVGIVIPADLSREFGNSFIFHLPVLVARLESDTVRWLVCPPMVFKKSKGLGDSFKGLFGGLTLPLEPRTERFDKIVRKRFEEALSSDRDLQNVLIQNCPKYNLLASEETKRKFITGLQMMKEMGWLKEKQFQEIRSGTEKQFVV